MTLDDINAGRREIERIESKISEAIRLRLKAVAGSVYVGTLRLGHLDSFYDVVNCLGMHRTKALIIVLTNQHAGLTDPEVETIFARSYATSVMAEILAGRGKRGRDRRTRETPKFRVRFQIRHRRARDAYRRRRQRLGGGRDGAQSIRRSLRVSGGLRRRAAA